MAAFSKAASLLVLTVSAPLSSIAQIPAPNARIRRRRRASRCVVPSESAANPQRARESDPDPNDYLHLGLPL